jgi:CO/xanthine dehydrogenase Mo-binding subunit
MNVSRRGFLQASGAIAISFTIPACMRAEAPAPTGSAILGNRLIVDGSGSVRLMLGKVELGQGIGTALAQLAAEELDVSFDRLQLVTVDTNVSPDESYTFSSISVQQAGPPTRRAAAAARARLLQQAAEQLDVDVDSLRAVDGEILAGDEPTGLSYWSLIGDREVHLEVVDEQALKPVADHTVVGQSYQRIDIPAKVFGGAAFLQDLRLPDMVHARVVRPAAERAELKAIDTSAAEQAPGVLKVIRDGNFIAVIAEREQQARNAARILHGAAGWRFATDMPDEEHIFDWLQNAPLQTEPVASKQADIDAETTTVSATYQRPYQAHASISPSAAIAQFDGERLTVWSHGQGMYPLRAGIAYVLGLDIENVRCIHYEASGCYGHNGADDAACDAAAIALQFPGRPVRLQWERADEMAWEPYGSAMQIEVSADVDTNGDVRNWNYELWSGPHSSRPRNEKTAGNMIYARHKADALPLPPIQSIPQPNGGADRNAVPLYAFDALNVTKHLTTEVPIRLSALRGLGAYANVFAIESFLDELALRAGVDPLDYRLRQLEDKRAIAVLEQLAEQSGWYGREPSADDGWGLGFARFKNRSAYVGVIVRVAMLQDGIRVKHASAVCDAGLVVNPDGASNQIEGGIVQSASWTLKEQIRFSNEKKQSLDWNAYPILRFDEVPDIEVSFVDRDDEPSLGVGEAAQGPTAAAIANALYSASGERKRRLAAAIANALYSASGERKRRLPLI